MFRAMLAVGAARGISCDQFMMLTQTWRSLLGTMGLAVAAMQLSAQQGRPSAAEQLNRNLQDLLTPVGVGVAVPAPVPGQEAALQASPAGAEHIRLAWRTASPGTLTIASRTKIAREILPVRRAVDLSADSLMVVAVDAKNQLKHWSTVHDPRFMRSEAPGPDGTLQGQIIAVASPELLVSVPDDASVTEVRIYGCKWDGKAFSLELLAKAVLQP